MINFDEVESNHELWSDGSVYGFSIAFLNASLHLCISGHDGEYGYARDLSDDDVEEIVNVLQQWIDWRRSGKQTTREVSPRAKNIPSVR